MDLRDLLYLIFFVGGPVAVSILQKRREKGAPPVRGPRAGRGSAPSGSGPAPGRLSPAGAGGGPASGRGGKDVFETIREKLREMEEAQATGLPDQPFPPRPRASERTAAKARATSRVSLPPRGPLRSAGPASRPQHEDPLPPGITLERSPARRERLSDRPEDVHYRTHGPGTHARWRHPLLEGVPPLPRHDGSSLTSLQHAFAMTEVFGMPRAMRPFAPARRPLPPPPPRPRSSAG